MGSIWVELAARAGGVNAIGPCRVATPPTGIVLDDRGKNMDLSTPARRASCLFGWISSPTAETRLDLASLLASTVPRWTAVNTSDVRAASRTVAALAYG